MVEKIAKIETQVKVKLQSQSYHCTERDIGGGIYLICNAGIASAENRIRQTEIREPRPLPCGGQAGITIT